ncbi:MAG: penicillin-binding protein activator LpoB [Bdellovibrionales bacterium]|nr:penicillin-binding protein activator LpoB [Bdellovibrionales bacterium]
MNRLVKTVTTVVVATLSAMILSSCGEKAFVKGDYEDPEKTNLMNDQWSETDMQNVVKDLVASLAGHPSIKDAKNPPVVMVTQLQNKTSEHIDTQSVMDMVRVDLMKTGKVGFIDKEARQDIADEYNYQNSGMVAKESKKGPGGQTGADFIINGRLDSIVQEVGKDKTVYYKVTLNMTNLKTGMIVWSDNKQIRKAYKKKTIGL